PAGTGQQIRHLFLGQQLHSRRFARVVFNFILHFCSPRQVLPWLWPRPHAGLLPAKMSANPHQAFLGRLPGQSPSKPFDSFFPPPRPSLVRPEIPLHGLVSRPRQLPDTPLSGLDVFSVLPPRLCTRL